jgi:hypothetical protein
MPQQVVPGIYEHYKGNRYVVVGVAVHHEIERPYVVYHAIEPHGASPTRQGTISLRIRPLHGHDGDPDGWLTPITDGNGAERERFKLLFPFAATPR